MKFDPKTSYAVEKENNPTRWFAVVLTPDFIPGKAEGDIEAAVFVQERGMVHAREKAMALGLPNTAEMCIAAMVSGDYTKTIPKGVILTKEQFLAEIDSWPDE